MRSAPSDPGLLLGDVHGLTTVEAEVVVSLCRVGPADPPLAIVHELADALPALATNPVLHQLLAHSTPDWTSHSTSR